MVMPIITLRYYIIIEKRQLAFDRKPYATARVEVFPQQTADYLMIIMLALILFHRVVRAYAALSHTELPPSR